MEKKPKEKSVYQKLHESKIISTRLSNAEYEILLDMCIRFNISISELVRNSIRKEMEVQRNN